MEHWAKQLSCFTCLRETVTLLDSEKGAPNILTFLLESNVTDHLVNRLNEFENVTQPQVRLTVSLTQKAEILTTTRRGRVSVRNLGYVKRHLVRRYLAASYQYDSQETILPERT